MNKNNIELKIIEKEMDINKITCVDLINFIIMEVDNIKDLYKKGKEKKELVLLIIDDFINDVNNIFCKAENVDIIYSLINLKNTKLISEIIDNIVYCANGNLNLGSGNKKKNRFICCY